MKNARGRSVLAVATFVMLSAAVPLRAQEKTPPEQKPALQLKVQIVLNEFDGTKKTASLPYTFFVNADDPSGRSSTQIRTGLRVPIAMGPTGTNVNTQFQYMDVGTNLDCRAFSASDGRYKLEISIDRTYLYAAPAGTTNMTVANTNPIVGHFTSSYNLLARDGQSVEATTTTDPISGHVLQVVVTAAASK